MIIDIANLTFAYPGSYDNVFEGLTARLDTDWRLGLIGRNGRGKTTLMRLINGEFPGDYTPSVHTLYFPYSVDTAQMCGDAVCAATDVLRWQLERELGLLGVDSEVLDRPFDTLSGGERTKVLLAALFAGEQRFLLIDEPTNHLDMRGREAVAAYLRTKKGFILVSHDRAFLDGCVDHIMSINKSSVDIISGNYSTWKENFDRKEAFELAENTRLKKEIGRLDATAKEHARRGALAESAKYAKGSKTGQVEGERGHISRLAAKVAKKAKTTERRMSRSADDKRELLKDFEETEQLKLWPQQHPQRILVRLENLTASYGDSVVLSNISMKIERGDRTALFGPNGCGKSTLLNLIVGAAANEPSDADILSGTLALASKLIVSYVPQDASFLHGGVHDYATMCGVDGTLFLTILRKLGFERVQFEKDMRNLSAGQQKKILLARSLCEQAHIYVWDEPLNYIDLPSREQLEKLILEFCPTLLLVEHDRAFLDRVATSRVEL